MWKSALFNIATVGIPWAWKKWQAGRKGNGVNGGFRYALAFVLALSGLSCGTIGNGTLDPAERDLILIVAEYRAAEIAAKQNNEERNEDWKKKNRVFLMASAYATTYYLSKREEVPDRNDDELMAEAMAAADKIVQTRLPGYTWAALLEEVHEGKPPKTEVDIDTFLLRALMLIPGLAEEAPDAVPPSG